MQGRIRIDGEDNLVKVCRLNIRLQLPIRNFILDTNWPSAWPGGLCRARYDANDFVIQFERNIPSGSNFFLPGLIDVMKLEKFALAEIGRTKSYETFGKASIVGILASRLLLLYSNSRMLGSMKTRSYYKTVSDSDLLNARLTRIAHEI